MRVDNSVKFILYPSEKNGTWRAVNQIGIYSKTNDLERNDYTYKIENPGASFLGYIVGNGDTSTMCNRSSSEEHFIPFFDDKCQLSSNIR